MAGTSDNKAERGRSAPAMASVSTAGLDKVAERENEEAARLAAEAAEAASKGGDKNEAAKRQQDALAKLNQPTSPPMSPGEAKDKLGDDQTVEMVFPRDVVVQLVGGLKVKFFKGVQNVPLSLAGHGYLKDHGVKPYERKSR